MWVRGETVEHNSQRRRRRRRRSSLRRRRSSLRRRRRRRRRRKGFTVLWSQVGRGGGGHAHSSVFKGLNMQECDDLMSPIGPPRGVTLQEVLLGCDAGLRVNGVAGPQCFGAGVCQIFLDCARLERWT